MNTDRINEIVANMMTILQDSERVDIRNMSDEELIELNKAWGRSICYSYNLNGFRSRRKYGSYPAEGSLKILKAVREKLQSNQI